MELQGRKWDLLLLCVVCHCNCNFVPVCNIVCNIVYLGNTVRRIKGRNLIDQLPAHFMQIEMLEPIFFTAYDKLCSIGQVGGPSLDTTL